MLHASRFWKEHFAQNLNIQRVDWGLQPNLTPVERKAILYSLKAWQLGETSEGHHLLAAARKYAARVGDLEYVEAVQLFIKEEQKHGSNLGRYIDLIGVQRAKKDWGDSLFRKVRYFNTSMELWTLTVVIVESAAQIFCQALYDATSCPLLKAICNDILVDEAHHIKFQNERLHIIFQRKGFYNRAFALLLYSGLFFAVIHAVWFGHRRALKAGGVDHATFMRRMYYKFFGTVKFLHREAEPEVR
ncbi:MAG TPA: ferritin-like domain-containing protein, partial [Flavobacteriales bacterium]|nr:ferritin-like domain-containing protein [Flavobacteriales bacterium]